MTAVKLKKLLQGLILVACLSPLAVTYAAQLVPLSGNLTSNAVLLKKFSLIQTLRTHHTSTLPKNIHLAQDLSDHKDTVNTFQLAGGYVDSRGQSHVRYNQYYREIPVWGLQIIYSGSISENTILSGFILDGIEQDVPDVNSLISIKDITKTILEKYSAPTNLNVKKIIYFDGESSNKAVLAYYVSYACQSADKVSIMTYIIDANTGNELHKEDQLPTGSTN